MLEYLVGFRIFEFKLKEMLGLEVENYKLV